MKAEQNELITRVGPDTAGGQLLRHYWQPVALVDEFDPALDPRMAKRPMKAVRLLGQDLVLFKDDQGRWGLLDRDCPHRGADLRELEGMLDIVQPGWRELEAGRQFLPEMIVTTAVPRSDRGGIPGRPGPAVPGAEGVLVAGDWVGPTGWLTNATLGSARVGARGG
jgi:hypothetical protein